MAENYTVETDIVYEGNGTVKEFPITFPFSDENEVVVYLNGEVIRRGYSIDGDSVVFNVAPANGDEIALAKAAVDTPEEEENISGESSESESNTVYDQASREHIKINPVPAKVKYSGNGEVTEFPTGFAFFENDNIIVYLNGAIINSGYSITGVGETEGGSVIFDEAPKEGDKIVILRQVAIERVTDFQEGGAFRAKNINDELDRQTAFCQQIQEQIDRCVKVEVTDDQTPEELLAEVYGKLDSATEVAQEAVDAANAATEAVASAEKTLAEVNTYVDESKAEINALITKTTEEIDQTISDATEEIKEVAVDAANEAVQETIGASVIEAATSAEHARIWAEGEQAEVKPLGGELSSMGAADLAYALANAPEDTPIDASGLFAMNVVKGEKGDKGDKGDAGKDGADGKDGVDGKDGLDTFATNCITEIPQDIKLELNDGTLTLKAGSKVYDGNGLITTTSVDKTYPSANHNGQVTLVWLTKQGGIATAFMGETVSSLPTATGSSKCVYNSTDKKCYCDFNSTWYESSFPLGLFTSTTSAFTSIDQVFNGFGYIGSTVFALPGVKGLIPNGRNEDGSLRNKEVAITSVKTFNSTITGKASFVINFSGVFSAYNNVYDENLNKNSNSSDCVAGVYTASSGVITALTPKLPFHAIDRNDSSWVAQQAMPSNKYINLTLGASGSTYTAPANGWVFFAKAASSSGQFNCITNSTGGGLRNDCNASNSGQWTTVSCPVKKGDKFAIEYSTSGETKRFRFIYAEGE